MAFKIGDVIIDRAQFGYGATKAGVPLYALTQLNNFNIALLTCILSIYKITSCIINVC